MKKSAKPPTEPCRPVELWYVPLPAPWGAGIAQWLERRTRDRKVAGSNPCWSGGGRIFFSRVNFLCRLLFRYPLHPRVTAVARKRPRSFCQMCRWQVTAKHARADMAAVSCGTSHVSAVSTSLRWILTKTRYKKLLTYAESQACAVSLLESGE